MVADLETLICKFIRYDCEFYKAFFFFFRASSGSSIPETFSQQLEGEYFSAKAGPVFPSSWAYVSDWFILLLLNVL